MFPIGLTLLVTVFLFLAIFILAGRKPGYSHIRDTISELGEVGAPDQKLVGFGVFLPVGLGLLAVAYWMYLENREVALLAGCIAVGYLVAAFFPCDPGSPMTGSGRQTVHNLGGAVEYFGGCVALIQIGAVDEPWFQGLGYMVGTVGIALSVPFVAPYRGLIQRMAEVCLLGGLLFAVVSL